MKTTEVKAGDICAIFGIENFKNEIIKKYQDGASIRYLSNYYKTTTITIYALWIVCFQNDKRITIVANKKDTAQHHL